MRYGFLNRLPFAPVVGGMFGIVAGILVLATPMWLFEQAVAGSGLPSLMSAATPPLGDKARIMAALLGIATIGTLVWLAISQIEKLTAKRPLAASAAPRPPQYQLEFLPENKPRPIFAEADLGAPLMSDEAMALGFEELVLDTSMIERTEPAEAGALQLASAAAESVGSMLGRLEEALERRNARVGNAPPVPGDIGSLRAALGMAA